MKTNLLIITIVAITSIVIGFTLLFYSQDIMMSTGMMVSTDCMPDELKHNDLCVKLEVPQHIGNFIHGTDSIISFCQEIPSGPGIGLERCIDIEYLNIDELIDRIQTNSTIPLTHPTQKYLSWCAFEFDNTKQEFHAGLEDYICDNPICPESEPPLFSSALHDNHDFIEKGCANFVEKWAYLTEDNDFTWNQVYWESFVKHHYHSDPISDPQRNQKCAELFDLIMKSAPDSNLWYELTETNDFVDAKCADIVEEWEHLTEHNVWDIGFSWDDIAKSLENEN